ncbi:hypothetical protein BDV3_004640 [Batrachochytrium dendrobatidis]|nr:asparagine-linked glycosylation protein [Batrachochytrium dendrobatidis]KAK5672293.1 asparagine-linked glycosylation protein [Batrachochytrium dendrobatidis]OAJ39272.1 hypothetical protein BDEG_23135 [Batrachochytrium dendrobatidis JEL423]
MSWPHSEWNSLVTVTIILLSLIVATLVAIFMTLWIVWPPSRQVQHMRLKLLESNTCNSTQSPFTIAFFHPHCDGGGGGERVLWTAINAIQQDCKQRQLSNTFIVVYSCPLSSTPNELLIHIKKQFDIVVDPETIRFVQLESWKYLEAKRYKRLTLLGQSLGSIITGMEAMQQLVPDVFVETVGYAFIYPIARFFQTKVVSYVHYPTISLDMLQKVQNRESSFNNAHAISNSAVLSTMKLLYYRAFSVLYGYAGSFSNAVMVNSSWTYGHINHIWNIPQRTSIVFPPCFTQSLSNLTLSARQRIILSIAQFRPEKNHTLQLEAFSLLLCDHPQLRPGTDSSVSLVLVGGVRNKDDSRRVAELRLLATKLGIEESVKIIENASYPDIESLLAKSLIGLHTMSNEHFGISIIEYMAAGVIPIAHNSGGPKMDIVKPLSGQSTGFLATTAQEYSDLMFNVLTLSSESQLSIQKAARESVIGRFSDSIFCLDFLAVIQQQRDMIQ